MSQFEVNMLVILLTEVKNISLKRVCTCPTFDSESLHKNLQEELIRRARLCLTVNITSQFLV